MKVYVCHDHDVHWISDTSVIVAEDETNARVLLDAALREQHLKPHDRHPYTLIEVPTGVQQLLHFGNGDY
jgi:hypothetical protein